MLSGKRAQGVGHGVHRTTGTPVHFAPQERTGKRLLGSKCLESMVKVGKGRDVLEGGRHSPFQVLDPYRPPIVPIEGGPKIGKLKCSWRQRR